MQTPLANLIVVLRHNLIHEAEEYAKRDSVVLRNTQRRYQEVLAKGATSWRLDIDGTIPLHPSNFKFPSETVPLWKMENKNWRLLGVVSNGVFLDSTTLALGESVIENVLDPGESITDEGLNRLSLDLELWICKCENEPRLEALTKALRKTNFRVLEVKERVSSGPSVNVQPLKA